MLGLGLAKNARVRVSQVLGLAKNASSSKKMVHAIVKPRENAVEKRTSAVEKEQVLLNWGYS